MNESGRAPSIIDGHIQKMRKKLKDLSIEDGIYFTASIQDLEACWDNLSAEYNRSTARGSSLGKPLADKNFPYHKRLVVSNKFIDNGCQLHDMCSEDEVTKWTLLLADETRNRYIFKSTDEIDTVSRVRPFDKISYPVKEKKVAGFIYPHFQTLKKKYEKALKDGLVPEDILSDFPVVIKGLIVALISLEEKFEKEMGNLDEYHLGEKLWIVQEGKIGTIICLTSPANREFLQDGRRWKDEYTSLSTYLTEMCGDTIKSMPYGFNAFLSCLPMVYSKERRIRLLKCPFFLTDNDKIMKYIPLMHAVMWICPGIKKELAKMAFEWEVLVRGKCGSAVDDVLNFDPNRGFQPNGVGFLRFLFNCVKHLEHHDKCGKIRELIDKVDTCFLDDVFYETYYACRWKTIPMLDFY